MTLRHANSSDTGVWNFRIIGSDTSDSTVVESDVLRPEPQTQITAETRQVPKQGD